MIQETFPMTVGGEEVLSERELLARGGERADDGFRRFGALHHLALFRYPL